MNFGRDGDAAQGPATGPHHANQEWITRVRREMPAGMRYGASS